MEHLRKVLGQPKRKFTSWEKVYIGSMTIVLSCRIALYILLRITGCVKINNVTSIIIIVQLEKITYLCKVSI